jgi:hypothetical protein
MTAARAITTTLPDRSTFFNAWIAMSPARTATKTRWSASRRRLFTSQAAASTISNRRRHERGHQREQDDIAAGHATRRKEGGQQRGPDITVTETATFRYSVIPVAKRVVNLPYMTAREVRRIPSDEDLWEVVLVPVEAEEVEVWAEFQPLSEADEAAS